MENPDPLLVLRPSDDVVVYALRRSRWSDIFLISILILLSALPYANALRNGFVYDDTAQVLNNPYIQNFRHLREIFTTTVWSYFGDFRGTSNYYRPIMTLGYLLCHRFFGPRPYGFHLANLIFHAGVVCILFLVTRRMFQTVSLSFVAAAVFALHPIHTEAVDWIAAVTELELTFFYLLTFWFFLGLPRPGERGSGLAQTGMVGSFVLALLSKEQAITLPVLATIYEHLYRSDRAETTWGQKRSRYVVLWLLALAYILVRARLLGGLAPALQRPNLGPAEVLLAALALIGQYAWKLLWPADLCAYYVFPEDIFPLLPWTVLGLVALIVCALLFAVLWTHGRLASFGFVWLLATLAPVLNARWMAGNVFTERYLYLPSVGFCWLVAWAVTRLWETTSTRRAIWRVALVAASLVIVPLSLIRILTRNLDWRNDIVLYKKTLAVAPDAYFIHNNLGAAYWNRGEEKAAEQEWNEAVKLAPNDEYVLHNLGLVSKREKRYEEAVGFFLRALRRRPNYTDAHLDLGLTYKEMGMLKEAEEQLRSAVALSPLSVRAGNSLGELCFDEGRLAEAEEQFRRSIESEPTREGYWDLGFVYWRKDDRDRAERAFKSAEALSPSSSRVHFILGLFYADAGRTSEAVREYQMGLQIDPANPEALAALKKLTSQVPYAKTSKP